MPEEPVQNPEALAALSEMPEEVYETEEPATEAVPDGNPEPEAPSVDDWTPPEFVVVNGERIPWEEAQSGIMRQADYTKKTTELKQQREEVEKYRVIMETWENRPDLRPLILQELAKDAGMEGIPTPQQGTSPQAALPNGLIGTYDPRDSEPEWSQRGYASEMELVLHRQQVAISGALGQVQGYFQQQQQAAQRDQSAAQAAQTLQSHGFTGATADAVKEAMLQTGINDPEAAYLKANLQGLASAVNAPKAPAAKKPQAPSGQNGRTFNPNDESLSADDIEFLLRRGFTPLPQ